MKKLRTIIIDDEADCVNLLKFDLTQNCPNVEVVATFTSTTKALNEIELLQPELLFLDIEMPVMNGFELLKQIEHINFNIIFVTAYNQFALKAFKFNALDYLVKPIDITELVDAVNRAEQSIKPTAEQLTSLHKEIKGEPINKIAIPSQNGVSFIDFNDIIYVEANNNYSKIFLVNKQTFTLSKTLKDIQDVLEERHFLRIHRQFIINLNHVKQFNRNDGIITMNNDAHLPIARSQKEKLAERFQWL